MAIDEQPSLCDCETEEEKAEMYRYLEAYWSGVVFLWSHLAMALTLAAMLVYHQWSGRHVGQTSTSVVLLSVYWVVRLLSNTSLLVVLQSADTTASMYCWPCVCVDFVSDTFITYQLIHANDPPHEKGQGDTVAIFDDVNNDNDE